MAVLATDMKSQIMGNPISQNYWVSLAIGIRHCCYLPPDTIQHTLPLTLLPVSFGTQVTYPGGMKS